MSVRELGNGLGNPLGLPSSGSSSTTTVQGNVVKDIKINELSYCTLAGYKTYLPIDYKRFFDGVYDTNFSVIKENTNTVESLACITTTKLSDSSKVLLLFNNSNEIISFNTEYKEFSPIDTLHVLGVITTATTNNTKKFVKIGTSTKNTSRNLFAIIENGTVSKVIGLPAEHVGASNGGSFLMTNYLQTNNSYNVSKSTDNGLSFMRYVYPVYNTGVVYDNSNDVLIDNTFYTALGVGGSSNTKSLLAVNMTDMSYKKYTLTLSTGDIAGQVPYLDIIKIIPASVGGVYVVTLRAQQTSTPYGYACEIGHLTDNGVYTVLGGIVETGMASVSSLTVQFFVETKDLVVCGFGCYAGKTVVFSVKKSGGKHSVTLNATQKIPSTVNATKLKCIGVVGVSNKLIIVNPSSNESCFGVYDLDAIVDPAFASYWSAGSTSAMYTALVPNNFINGANIQPVDLSKLSDYATYYKDTTVPLVSSVTSQSYAAPTGTLVTATDHTADFSIVDKQRSDVIEVKGEKILINGIPTFMKTGV